MVKRQETLERNGLKEHAEKTEEDDCGDGGGGGGVDITSDNNKTES